MDSLIVSAQYPWSPWECRGYPLSATEETAFAHQLRQVAADQIVEFRRGDVSVLMDALRSGFPVSSILKLLPGMDPASLWSAYCTLDNRLRDASRVWAEYVAEPHDYLLGSNGDVMQALFPIPFADVIAHLHPEDTHHPKGSLSDLLRAFTETTVYATTRVLRLEAKLATAPTLRQRQAIGYQLFNPFDEHEWQHPYFHPQRVGQLSLMRVIDLLGEVRE